MNREEAQKYGKTIVGSKWVFKKENEPDGSTRFKSCIVSKGYMQIPGVDYTEKFTPIASDTTTRMILVFSMYFSNEGWVCESVIIEAAFLEGYNSGLQFMEWPPGTVTLGFATKEEVKRTCLQML